MAALALLVLLALVLAACGGTEESSGGGGDGGDEQADAGDDAGGDEQADAGDDAGDDAGGDGGDDAGDEGGTEEPEELLPVTVAYCAQSWAMAPTFVARDAGIYEKHGLEAEVQFMPLPQQIAQSAAGRLDLGQCDASGIIPAILEGADITELAVIIRTLQGQIWGAEGIESMEDLRGQVVGAWGPTASAPTGAMIHALENSGLDPDNDVTWRTFDGTSDMFSALVTGQIQAGVVYVPADLTAEQEGLNLLYDTAEDDRPWPSASFFVPGDQDPEVTDRFARVILEVIHFIKNNPDEAAQSIMEELEFERPQADRAVEYFTEQVEDVPKWSDELVMANLEIAENMGVEDAMEANPSELYDNSFLEKLEDEGFLESLE